MNPENTKAIRSNLHYVASNTGNIGVLLNLLEENGVFGTVEIQQIKTQSGDYAKATQLYNMIAKKDDSAFPILVNSLKESGNAPVANRLDNTNTGQVQGNSAGETAHSSNNLGTSGTRPTQIVSKSFDFEDDNEKEEETCCRDFHQMTRESHSFENIRQSLKASEIETQGHHLDFSAKNFTDENIPNLKGAINNEGIHVLILSKNMISKNGFLTLLRYVPKTLKYLMLDRNHIHFDETRFNAVFSPDSPTFLFSKCPNLKVLDLSYNFIDPEWITKLQSFPQNKSKEGMKDNSVIRYIRINNCKVIFQRYPGESPDSREIFFVPTICSVRGTKISKTDDFIYEERGCVAWAEAKRLPFLNYSTHVLIIIEWVHRGQRELYTAELRKNNNDHCSIRFFNTDPFEPSNNGGIEIRSVRDQLEQNFTIPRRGYTDKTKIQNLIKDIKDTKDKIGFEPYSWFGTNCYTWANQRFNNINITGMPKIKIPITIKMCSYIADQSDLLIILLVIIFSMAAYKLLF